MNKPAEEIRRLRGMRWVDLQAVAMRETSLTPSDIRGCATLDSLRLKILRAKFPSTATEVVG
jgi:hypothetical protein